MFGRKKKSPATRGLPVAVVSGKPRKERNAGRSVRLATKITEIEAAAAEAGRELTDAERQRVASLNAELVIRQAHLTLGG